MIDVKIGLIRHYKVKHEYPTGTPINADELNEWFRRYDEAEIERGYTDLQGFEWNECFTSDLPRAVKTAEIIYKGSIRKMAELQEVPPPRFTMSVKLPFFAWAILIRSSMFFNKQTRQAVRQAKSRVNEVLDKAVSLEKENVLIVSHAGLMMFMRKELIRRGFKGPTFRHAENGKLYIFEN
ncbi:histidine phosphatase family protein [Brevibacillus sp. SIMBA_040]|uniref:histidine phosphatase family protein n=1 Tax=unclassified Brevibacillus TaxID=2684853 RepID=UPI00397A28F2